MDTKESLVRIVLLSLLLYAALSLASSGSELKLARSRQAELKSQLELRETERLALTEELERQISPEDIEQLARQRLGLVRPGEKIFYFTTDREG